MRISLVFTLLFSIATTILPRAPLADVCQDNQPTGTTCLNDAFADFWQSNGGLPVFGYAISNAQLEQPAGANQAFLTQWTERNRLELHPENSAPYTILLGRMGAERLAQLGRDPNQAGREAGPIAGCLWFAETGHNVCNQAGSTGFANYWQSHGLNIAGMNAYNRALALFGLPLTAAQPEQTSDGQTFVTQWFERARFEWHPENPVAYMVQLGLLGNEVQAAQGSAAPVPSVFGVSISREHILAVADRATEANTHWVRYSHIKWSEIEPQQGERRWSQMANADAELQSLANHGLQTIAVIHSVPEWAQQIRGRTCGPIKPTAYAPFASFLHDLVARYSQAPYHVKYWEIWNEPDVDPALVGPSSEFGCIGASNDPFYGGGAYAELLKQVYPAIKQANPAAQVLVGGLLLDCDPVNPVPASKNCSSGKFLEGILQNGGGTVFDIISYHGYAFWNGKNDNWDLANSSWRARGGQVFGKLQFIRETLARYQVSKPILLTEAGLLCYGAQCKDRFFDAQASYLVRVYTRSIANGLLGTLWYTLDGPGWELGGLLDANQQPRPAFQTLKFLSGLLTNATYAGDRSNGAIEGYAFQKGNTQYAIYWTNDDTQATLALPTGTRALYDIAGQSVPISGSSIEIGFQPLIVEIAP